MNVTQISTKTHRHEKNYQSVKRIEKMSKCNMFLLQYLFPSYTYTVKNTLVRSWKYKEWVHEWRTLVSVFVHVTQNSVTVMTDSETWSDWREFDRGVPQPAQRQYHSTNNMGRKREADLIYTVYTKVCRHPFKWVNSAISAIPVERCMKSSTQPCNLHRQTLAVEWPYWWVQWL